MDLRPPDPARDEFRRLVDLELARLETSAPLPVAPDVSFTAYHRAAAVLASFDLSLKPDGPPGDATIDDVLVDAEPVSAKGEPRFRLRPEIRRLVLTALSTPAAMRQALRANPELACADDPVQVMLEAYIDGRPPVLAQQTLTQLTATFEVAPWLSELVPSAPTPDEVRMRLEFETLLSPFVDLVGSHFGGRVTELQQLRDYVGVLEPSSFVEGVRRGFWNVLRSHEKPPLVIYGPGGYGKSTLIARFLLEHARLDDERRFPFAYIDFDRATIDAGEPLTILVEAVRQLGIQFAHARRRGDDIREAWRKRMARAPRRNDKSAAPRSARGRRHRDRTPYLNDFRSFLKTLALEDRPMLLVLDTLEEVQRRNTAYVQELWQFLGELRQINPRLRTVLSGRAPVTGEDFDGKPMVTTPLELKRLDPLAAAAILEKQGLRPDQAAQLASRLGGSPLTLRLAAELMRKQTEAPGAADADDFDEEVLGRAVAQGEIERYLYTRILEHIDNPQVRQLAHPGLILRRITPELILRVLAEPCGVPVKTDAEAQTLFDILQREVSLVMQTDDERNALRHRPDVRRLMLAFMERTDRAASQRIHRAAVAYYAARPGSDPTDRAEEIYHRLALEETEQLDERWMSGVEPQLFSALEELPSAARAWLATRLQVELAPSERRAAPLEVWERDADRRARELLALAQPGPALEILRERVERSSASPLYLTEADVLAVMRRLEEALAVLDRGITHAYQTGSDVLRGELLLAAARLELLQERPDAATRRLDEAEPLARRLHDAMWMIQIGLGRIDAWRATRSDGHEDDDYLVALQNQVAECLASVPDEQLTSNPDLALRAAIAANDLTGVMRVVRLIGFAQIGSTQRRELLDVLKSMTADFLRRSESFVRRRSEKLSTEALLSLAVDFDTDGKVPASDRALQIASSFSSSVERYLAIGDSVVPFDGAPLALTARTRITLSPDQTTRAFHALKAICRSIGDLETLLELRLGRSVASITAHRTLDDALLEVLTDADEEDYTGDLLAAAFEWQPGEAVLRRLLGELGLIQSVSGVVKQLASLRKDVFPERSAAQLEARLWTLQGQVCRIEPEGLDGANYFTGILVAPDIVFTVASALSAAIADPTKSDRVQVRFDYLRRDGVENGGGAVYRLERGAWLIDYIHPDAAPGFDFACIRLAGQPAYDTIGGGRARSDAPRRDWIHVMDTSPPVKVRSPLVLAECPRTNPLTISINTHGIDRLIDDGREMRYRSLSRVSPGAPLFDVDLRLIGMHRGSVSGWRNLGMQSAMPLAALMALLRERSRLDFLNASGAGMP